MIFGAISLTGLGVYYSPRSDSAYVAGRKIGDEYQYILDRRLAKKFVGNMLERPSLLLNPWSIRKTATEKEVSRAGDEFGAAGPPPATPAMVAPATSDSGAVGARRRILRSRFLSRRSAGRLQPAR